MTNKPEQIFISISSLPQALKDGVGSYYPNFTGDAAQLNLAAYVPRSKVKEAREAAWRDAAQKLRKKAEDYRAQGERWQQNAESAGMKIIREQDYAD